MANPLAGWLSHIRDIRQNPQAFKQSVGNDPLRGLMSVFMPGAFQSQPQQAPQQPQQPIMPVRFNNMRQMRPMAPPTGMRPLVENNMAAPTRPPLPPVTTPQQIPQFNQPQQMPQFNPSQLPFQQPQQQQQSRAFGLRDNLNNSIMRFLGR